MGGTRRKPGKLGPYIDGYRSRLLGLGYTSSSVRGLLKHVGRLGRWMAMAGIDPDQLDIGAIKSFLADDGFRRPTSMRTCVSLLDYLRDAGVVRVQEAARTVTPLEEFLEQYREWMVRERALAPMTVLRYERLARRFLSERRSNNDALGVGDLSGAEVAGFLVRECSRLSVGAAKGRVADLRSLLRYLHLRGLTPPLAEAVPPVAGWHDTTVPVGVTPSDVEAMLASCDRSTLAGTRDFAIITLLARLGLRSGEVANIEFGDLDWRAGEIVVRGKARRQDRMPLPSDAGEALVAYLTARERGVSRRVFLTLRAPRRPIPPAVVGEVVERACGRAGVNCARAHRIRHALATELLRRGASLIDISQVLRHRDLATTAVYAKVDLERLRQVAQPWPEVAK